MLSDSFTLLRDKQDRTLCEQKYLDGDVTFTECPCWQITEETPSTFELSRLDHVGIHAMVQSCQKWAEAHYTGGDGPHNIYIGTGLRAVVEGMQTFSQGYTLCAVEWPVPLLSGPRKIQMVLRKRVELTDDDQRARMASIIEKHPRWKNALRDIKEETRPRFSHAMTIETQGRQMTVDMPGLVIWGTVTRILASYGFSTSPSTIAFAAEKGLGKNYSYYKRRL